MQLEEALKKIALLESVTKEMDEQLAKFKSMDISALENEVKSYREIGTVEDLTNLVETAEEMKDELSKYQELGEYSDLEVALDGMIDFTKEFKERLGNDIDEVENALKTSTEVIESYKELGTLEDIQELMDKTLDINEKLSKYESLLTLDEAVAVVESFEDDLKEIQVSKLQESFNISEPFAVEMLEKWGSLDEAEKVLTEVAGSLKKVESKDEDGEENKESDGEKETPANESVSTSKTNKERFKNLLGL